MHFQKLVLFKTKVMSKLLSIEKTTSIYVLYKSTLDAASSLFGAPFKPPRRPSHSSSRCKTRPVSQAGLNHWGTTCCCLAELAWNQAGPLRATFPQESVRWHGDTGPRCLNKFVSHLCSPLLSLSLNRRRTRARRGATLTHKCPQPHRDSTGSSSSAP